jgi:hypothetical protein
VELNSSEQVRAAIWFYKIDKRGHIQGLPEAVDCLDDTEALEKAKERANGRAIEVWNMARRVCNRSDHAEVRRLLWRKK